MAQIQDILTGLDARRRELGMSCPALARRSALDVRTVQRAMRDGSAGLSAVLAMADVLGVDLAIVPRRSSSAVRRQQAREKAHRLVSLAQGTAALESQAVDFRVASRAQRTIKAKLLAGPPLRLWAE